MRKALNILITFLCMIYGSNIQAQGALTLDSLNNFLASEEAKHGDIVPGTHRSVRWVKGIQQSDLSIIYLHGFSASGKEISPTVEMLADRLDANLYYARLAGHGRSDDAMLNGSIDAWLRDTRQAYEIGSLIGKQVIVVSTSTGGTLATWLVSQTFAGQLLANIMISPNYGIKRNLGRIVQWPWGLAFAKWLNGPYYSFEPTNPLHEQYWTERYPMEALLPMFELLDFVDGLDKSVIELPQMVIFSPDDQVVSSSKIEQTIKKFTRSDVTLVRYNNSTDPYQHVLAGDANSPESTTEIVALMSDYINALLN